MNRIVLEQRVRNDGILQIEMRLGAAEAGEDVCVTIEPIDKKEMTPDEWRAGILATAGGWQGEFERPSQDKLEEREPLS